MVGDVTVNGIDFCLPAFTTPLWPACAHSRFISGKLQAPHWIELHRDHGGVVSPVLECGPMARDEGLERFRSIPTPPSPQDHVMGARKCVDAVDLDKAEVEQHVIEIGAAARSRSGTQQQVPVQKKTSRALVVQKWALHAVQYR